uniref:ATP-dependent DNA helicase n=1 Tax=Arcella intermedia TaxID=1963864 RepID=A0A6B2L2G7_9EUKA
MNLDFLSPEQKKLVEFAIQGKSFFFTGAAGTGKSFVLKTIVKALRDKHGEGNVFVCASTGIAACNIGGCTVHSFAGIGLGGESKEKMLQKVLSNSNAVKRWRSAVTLIIDEVSMIEPDFFDLLEHIGQKVRNSKRTKALSDLPFGGIQVILCGDFFQLPPVKSVKYLFQAKCWKKVINFSTELRTVFRQKDAEFVKLLNEVRRGILSKEGLEMLKSCQGRKFNTEDGIEPTVLYPTKHNVDQENSQQLEKLEGVTMLFKARDTSPYQNNFTDQLKKNCSAKDDLKLKIGAQVILLKNISQEKELVNGARGTIINFVNDEKTGLDVPLVKFINGTYLIRPEKWAITVGKVEVAAREQIPLDLAWAMSIHKSQGMTIDRLKVSIDKVFASGQAYVALSRATSLEVSHNDTNSSTHPKRACASLATSTQLKSSPTKQSSTSTTQCKT